MRLSLQVHSNQNHFSIQTVRFRKKNPQKGNNLILHLLKYHQRHEFKRKQRLNLKVTFKINLIGVSPRFHQKLNYFQSNIGGTPPISTRRVEENNKSNLKVTSAARRLSTPAE
jgi:hypothetical protein